MRSPRASSSPRSAWARSTRCRNVAPRRNDESCVAENSSASPATGMSRRRAATRCLRLTASTRALRTAGGRAMSASTSTADASPSAATPKPSAVSPRSHSQPSSSSSDDDSGDGRAGAGRGAGALVGAASPWLPGRSRPRRPPPYFARGLSGGAPRLSSRAARSRFAVERASSSRRSRRMRRWRMSRSFRAGTPPSKTMTGRTP